MLIQRWYNLVSTLRNVVSTLLQRFATLFRRYFNVGLRHCATLCNIEKPTLFHFQSWINVISTLIHNVETTLVRRWNLCWELPYQNVVRVLNTQNILVIESNWLISTKTICVSKNRDVVSRGTSFWHNKTFFQVES